MILRNMFSYLNDDILNICIFFKFIEVPCTGLISKTKTSLLALSVVFIININKNDHNFGAPATGSFYDFFFHMGDSVGLRPYILFKKYQATKLK